MTKNLRLLIMLLIIATSFAQAETIDDIIAGATKARGNIKEMTKIKYTMEMEMRIMGMNMPMKMYFGGKEKVRVETNAMGMNMVTVINGKKGWMSQNGVVTDIPMDKIEQTTKSFQDQGLGGDNDLFNYKELGLKVNLAGKEKLENGDNWKIVIARPDNFPTTIWINCETYLTTKMNAKMNAQGMDMEVDMIFKEYKKFSGYLMPELMEMSMNKGAFTGQTQITKFEIVDKFDDKLFQKP